MDRIDGAGGVRTGDLEGVPATWVGWIDGSFSFDGAGGSSSDDWDWYGTADIDAMTPEGPLEMALQSSAGGPLSGSASSFTLSGQQSTTGQGTFMGITTNVGPIPNPVDPIDVVFVDASCNVAFADWTTSLEELAAEGGFAGSLDGFCIATNIAPAGDPEEVADLATEYDELYGRAVDAVGSIHADFGTPAPLDYLGRSRRRRSWRLKPTCSGTRAPSTNWRAGPSRPRYQPARKCAAYRDPPAGRVRPVRCDPDAARDRGDQSRCQLRGRRPRGTAVR